ncbi:SusC/RagA family TonB-linked outer membrane protein [Mongoliibacter ruber]|uniref:TonB-linked SusC/RagA family outer membrane protein n=1 Tax=Mongoliibacter ruber TaxID=1750599 RepID=A0A2T0WHM4_9BACT|nr:TonB-dependent receptor [Mongoliibacter ruber]PRY86162.1 TonB-linked SusC/RagA family outer membrane protein [Mongoliibacter ruber]
MKKILLAAILYLVVAAGHVFAQQRTVSGTVISSADNQPIPGANIQIKGTNIGTVTDIDGQYSIQVQDGSAVLIFTYIGYVTQESLVGNRDVIDMTLNEDLKQLGEVIIVGYGEQDRKTLTSSISSVSSKDIENLPMPSPDQMMQGRAAGVLVSANSGTPGGGMFVRVRGSTSINADNDPLYVVDGIPIVSGNLSAVGLGGGTANAMADINPADIESMEILKDASATAIYGARAANGVVLITTKRGKSQKAKVSIGAYHGVQSAWRKPDLVDGSTFEMLRNEAAVNNGGEPIYANPSQAISTNYSDLIFRDAPITNFDVSVTGGNDQIRYLASASDFNQDGIVAPTSFARRTGRLNLDAFVSDKLKIGTSILYSRNIRNRVNNDDNIAGALGGTHFFPSNLPPFQQDGSYTKFSIFENPLAVINENDITMVTNRVLATVYGEYEFFPGLTLRSNFSVDYNNVKEDTYINTFLNAGAAVNGQASSIVSVNDNWIQENVLNYQTSFGSGHSLSVLLGTSLQQSTFERTTATGQQFPSNDFKRIASAAVQTSSSDGSVWGIASVFSRVNYSLNNKYLLTLNLRRDGSSRFGAANRWGTFPSAAVGWRISEEDFFNKGKFVSDLKVRSSYGVTGNQNGINDFQSRGLWAGGANYAITPGTEPSQLANPDLRWERTAQFNIGVDVAFFNERLNMTFDYYDKQTTDLLLAVPIPRSSGFTSIFQNFGEMENKGFELSITGTPILKQDFTWDINFNIAQNRNNIKRLAQSIPVYNRDIIRMEEGIPMYSFWMHNQLGVDTETGDPIWETSDPNRPFDPNIDRFIVGNAWPDFFGGLTNTFRYKNFDAMIFFQYSYGNDQLFWNRFFQEHGGTRNTNFLGSQLDRWQQPGDVTMVPRMTNANYAANLRPSRFVEDGSYVRLKNLSIGYTLPPSFASKLGMTSARIYFSGQNLLTFTNYSGLDPEVNSTASTSTTQGVDFYAMPQPRVFMGGFNITF